MEIKKSPKADLENKKLTSYLLGYIFILATIFVAFEWTESEITFNVIAQGNVSDIEEEIIPFTEPIKPPPPPPPPPQAQDIINIVEEEEAPEEVEILETEADERTEVQSEVFDPNAEYGTGEEVTDDIFPVEALEKMPEFPGGNVQAWVLKNLKYPRKAKNRNIQGRTFITFVIEKDGKVTQVQIDRSSGNEELDEEAVRVVNMMPNWKPGMQGGRTVRVRYRIPITFRLT